MRMGLIAVTALIGSFMLAMTPAYSDNHIPSLLGTWSGDNNTISTKKGFKTWTKTITITEQKDRRFIGHFIYSEGRKDFFGVIHPDNKTFTWVVPDSRGYNLGHVHSATKISACYVESGIDATAGCSELTKK